MNIFIVTISGGDRETYFERFDTVWLNEENAQNRVKQHNNDQKKKRFPTVADYDTFATQDA